jgi:hypothetical protein
MAPPDAVSGNATAELEVPKSIAQNVVMAESAPHGACTHARKGWEGRAFYHESLAHCNRSIMMHPRKEKRAVGPRVFRVNRVSTRYQPGINP